VKIWLRVRTFGKFSTRCFPVVTTSVALIFNPLLILSDNSDRDNNGSLEFRDRRESQIATRINLWSALSSCGTHWNNFHTQPTWRRWSERVVCEHSSCLPRSCVVWRGLSLTSASSWSSSIAEGRPARELSVTSLSPLRNLTNQDWMLLCVRSTSGNTRSISTWASDTERPCSNKNKIQWRWCSDRRIL
jgi:hypothetical protein